MIAAQGPTIPADGRSACHIMRSRVNTIHMVGIGGSGMSGIAEVLLNLGFTVTGSDLSLGSSVSRLKRLGAQVYIGHGAENLGETDVLVKSTAVSEDNPEVAEARRRGIPVIPRAEMLAELMRLRTGIAVAGTHGKTTTTSLLATIFTEAGFDPTVIIGGRLNAYGSNARLGEGRIPHRRGRRVRRLLPLPGPHHHRGHQRGRRPSRFLPGIDAIDDSFVRFMNRIPFYGMNVVCGDDPGVRRILPRINRPVLTYGLGPDSAVRGEVVTAGIRSLFKVYLGASSGPRSTWPIRDATTS